MPFMQRWPQISPGCPQRTPSRQAVRCTTLCKRYPINHFKHASTQPPPSTRQSSSNGNTQQRHLWQYSSAKTAATGLKRSSSLLTRLLIYLANLLQNNYVGSSLIGTTPSNIRQSTTGLASERRMQSSCRCRCNSIQGYGTKGKV